VKQRDDLNKEVFTEDGWFMTGDIGQWAEDGTLSIIDRVKVRPSAFFAPRLRGDAVQNLVKLSGGEYIALEVRLIRS
jgi:long-chain acyl-CoA synthetase